jgi:hypothetical protein
MKTGGPPSASSPKRVSHGTWGGQGIRIEVDEPGAEIEFDCARGRIPGPIAIDEKGGFEVQGVLVRESPGPIRVGHEPKEQPARYAGSVEEKTMTLRVMLTDSSETFGTYSLTQGSAGRVRKCR